MYNQQGGAHRGWVRGAKHRGAPRQADATLQLLEAVSAAAGLAPRPVFSRPEEVANSSAQAAGRRVLVADDEPINQLLATLLLEQMATPTHRPARHVPC